jgi:hypothetical protein
MLLPELIHPNHSPNGGEDYEPTNKIARPDY